MIMLLTRYAQLSMPLLHSQHFWSVHYCSRTNLSVPPSVPPIKAHDSKLISSPSSRLLVRFQSNEPKVCLHTTKQHDKSGYCIFILYMRTIKSIKSSHWSHHPYNTWNPPAAGPRPHRALRRPSYPPVCTSSANHGSAKASTAVGRSAASGATMH